MLQPSNEKSTLTSVEMDEGKLAGQSIESMPVYFVLAKLFFESLTRFFSSKEIFKVTFNFSNVENLLLYPAVIKQFRIFFKNFFLTKIRRRIF